MSLYSDIREVFRKRSIKKIEQKIAKVSRARKDLTKKSVKYTRQMEDILGQSHSQAPKGL